LSGQLDPFDLDAAYLRRSQVELSAFVEALAVRLEGSLPGRVEIDRRRDGFLSKTSHVARIVLRCDQAIYELSLSKGQLTVSRAKLVRGVKISSVNLKPSEWLGEVRREVQTLAEQAGAASDVLHGFL
jgi:hypothetical protein